MISISRSSLATSPGSLEMLSLYGDDAASRDQAELSHQLKNDVPLVQVFSDFDGLDVVEKKKSWRALFIMVFSFLSATILVILHDGMNRSLDGNPVNPNGSWNQQWTSRYATALAFLIRMFFVISVGTAFVQRQWLNLSTNQQTIRVRDLDTLSSGLSSPFSWICNTIWLKNPVLLMMVVVSWTLPLATIVTPGTLVVESRPHIDTIDRTAVYLSSNCNDFGEYFLVDDPDTFEESEAMTFRVRENYQLSQLAFTAATSSQIIPMGSNLANQTFSTNFVGPTLRCTDANSTTSAEIIQTTKENGAEFMAWTGDNVPWLHGTNKSSLIDWRFETSIMSSCSGNNETGDFDPLGQWDVYAISNRTDSNYTLWIVWNHLVKECQLWNATYEVEFAYQNFEQNTIVRSLTYQNPISTVCVVEKGADPGTSSILEDSSVFHKSVLSAFASLIVGMGNFLLGEPAEGDQQSNFYLLNISNSTTAQLNQGVEEAFQNLTLSLFSVPQFLANTTDITSTNVTSWSNTYVYEQRDLLLAYGISFVASLICLIIGLYSFYRNGSSFQNTFSTYIRAAEGSDLDIRSTVPVGDTGADPLPKKLGEKIIKMACR